MTRLQPRHGSPDHRQHSAGLQFGRRHHRDRSGWRTKPCRARCGSEWTELMYMQIRERKHGRLCVLAGRALRIPHARGALYGKLDVARGRDSWSCRSVFFVRSSAFGSRGTRSTSSCRSAWSCSWDWPVKNSILIVEFAKRLHEEGKPLKEATKEASRLRLRPILMTSFAFILGVLPLVVATGSGGGDATLARHGRVRRHDRRHRCSACSSRRCSSTSCRGSAKSAGSPTERTRNAPARSFLERCSAACGGYLLAKLDIVFMTWGIDRRRDRRRGHSSGLAGDSPSAAVATEATTSRRRTTTCRSEPATESNTHDFEILH